MKKLCLAVLAFALVAMPAALVAEIKPSQVLVQDSAVVSGSFGNGLSFMVLPNKEPANRIYLRLVVKAGSVLEDDDQKGIAHLVEHMAFNGSEHFKKNELIDYFESIGMAFGPEVNAYTSFDETVYMLEIPADSPESLDKALTVLRDWACALSFDQEELDKERGVVVEEWRLGRGAEGRVGDKTIPFLFNGSKYGLRLPIGDPEIIKSVARQRVVDFYRAWYRPELMTVVAVGALEPADMVKKIESALGTIPASAKRVARSYPGIPAPKPNSVLVVRDPELQYTTVQILDQKPYSAPRTARDYRREVVNGIARAALNARLEEKTVVSDPLMLGAGMGSQTLAKNAEFTYAAVIPVPGKFTPSFKQLMEELLRMRRFGVTEAELARQKRSVLDSIEQTWLNREKIHSANRAQSLVASVTSGMVSMSYDDMRDLYRSVVPGITTKEVSAEIDRWFAGRGRMLLVSAPDSASDIPSEAELVSLWQKWVPETTLAQYAETGLDRPLNDGAGIVPGSIVKEETVSSDGIKLWTLSNGARVYVLKTDFKDNEIQMSAWSKGGSSLVPDSAYPSASVAASYADASGLNGFSAVDLGKKLAGKTVSLNVWLSDALEGMDGSSSVADVETLAHLINAAFARPNFTAEGWQSTIAQLKSDAEARGKDPDKMFEDLKSRLLYGANPRHEPPTLELIARMNQAEAERVRRERFADAGDFSFAFVGSIDEAALRPIVEKWIASLPSSGTREEARDVTVPFPKGTVSDSLKMGLAPQSKVLLAFGGKADRIPGEDIRFYSMMQLLEIRFREVIREEMSGTYGVDVGGYQAVYPVPEFKLTVSFGCEPRREEKLSEAVLEQIRQLQSAPVPETYITKLRETLRRNREESLKTNGYWIWQIERCAVRGMPLSDITATEKAVALITGESIRDALRKYADTSNYVKAYLLPEATKASAEEKLLEPAASN